MPNHWAHTHGHAAHRLTDHCPSTEFFTDNKLACSLLIFARG
jgi:hypothetical protein